MSDAALQNVVNMPRGGNLLDTIQSGGYTLNTFNKLDSDTVHCVFVGSFNSFHRNKTAQGNNFSYKNRNGFSQSNKYRNGFSRSNNYRNGFSTSNNYRERHLADFPQGLLSQALTGTFLPRGDLITANLVGVVSSSNSSNFKGNQWQQLLGQGSGATHQPMRAGQDLPTIVYLGHL